MAARRDLLNVAEKLLGCSISPDAFLVSTSGRYEYRNKGIDVFIEAMNRVRTSGRLQREVVAFIMVPAWVRDARADLKEVIDKNIRTTSPMQMPFVTHWLNQMEQDKVLNYISHAGFTNSATYGFAAPVTWGPMAVGLIGIVWFVMRNLRAGKRYREAVAKDKSALPQPPLLDLEVLKNRSFTVGTITASLAFFAFSSILVIMPLYIQTDRGYSATMSGLIMLPGAIGQCISQFFGGRAMDRFGARPVALFGSIVLTLGTLGMSLVAMDTWIWWVSICQFIRQIGMGFLLMPITTWSLNCLNGPSEVSAGSSVTNTARQIAGAVGAPVLVILMETFAALHKQGGASAVAASIFGIQWALRISAIICLAMVLMVFFGVKGDGAGRTRDIISLRALRERRARRMAAN